MNLTRREALKSIGAGFAGILVARLPQPQVEEEIPPIPDEDIGLGAIEMYTVEADSLDSDVQVNNLPTGMVSTVFYFEEDAEDGLWHSHVWRYVENKPVLHILDGKEVFRLEQEGPVRMQVHLQPHPETRSWTMHGVEFQTWKPSVPPTFTIGTEEMIGL